MVTWKACLKQVIPKSVLRLQRQYRRKKLREGFEHCATAKETFSRVYEGGYWGRSKEPEEKYYSGPGTHKDEAVALYLSAVNGFLQSLGERPDVVDLGCGDFAIGSRIRPNCRTYIAADVVEGLIERDRKRYANDNVEFRVLDIINDDLPGGDVVFLREVLQHLSNSDIGKVAAKLPEKYRYLILTESLPRFEGFLPNLDKPRGPDIRSTFEETGSGVVLTEPPFNLKVTESTLLCEAYADDPGRKSVIRTNIYKF
jgi:SAM-dependent methyltransferase